MSSSRHKNELFDQLWLFYWQHVDFGAYTHTLDFKEATFTSKMMSVHGKVTPVPK